MQWTDRIGRRLKPRDLHVFLAVAEHGNMAKAAEWLAISRPVVSKTIADLEHILGVRLLDRTSQGVEPTLYGRALFKRALAVFDELNQSVREIEYLCDPTAGEVRVACNEVMSAGLVSVAADRLLRRHPQWVFRLQLANAAAHLELLRSRACEVVVGRPELSQSPPDVYDSLNRSHRWPMLSAQSQPKQGLSPWLAWQTFAGANRTPKSSGSWNIPAPTNSAPMSRSS